MIFWGLDILAPSLRLRCDGDAPGGVGEDQRPEEERVRIGDVPRDVGWCERLEGRRKQVRERVEGEKKGQRMELSK